jgi:glycosyltransferase involved in cell wall biosynthesis
MIKVFLSALAARTGGGRTYVQDLLANFPPDCGRVSILSPFPIEGLPDRPDVEWIRAPRWTIHPVSRFLLGWLWFRFLWPRRNEFDVALFAGGSFDAPLPKRVPGVVVFRNMLPYDRAARRCYPLGWMRLRHALLWHVQGWAMRRADLVIFISDHGRRVIDRTFGRRRGESVTIHHAVNQVQAALDPATAARLPESFVLYLSSIDAYKAQVELVEAWARLRAARATTEKLVLVGPEYAPYARRVRKAIRRHGLEDEVTLFGAVRPEEAVDLARRAELNLFLSTCENCPISLLELMSSGRPILISDREPMTELGGPELVYADPCDPDAVAAGIGRLLDDELLRRRVGAAAEQRSWAFRSSRSGDSTWHEVLATAGQPAAASDTRSSPAAAVR